MNIELKEKKTDYRCSEAIEGEACWTLDPAPPALFVRLYWRADSGDPVVAAEVRIDHPATGHEHHAFSLKAPDAPWSFAGALFKILWFVRLEDGEGHSGSDAEIVIAPSGRAIASSATPTT